MIELRRRMIECLQVRVMHFRADALLSNFPCLYFVYCSAPKKWIDTYGSSPTTQLSWAIGGI